MDDAFVYDAMDSQRYVRLLEVNPTSSAQSLSYSLTEYPLESVRDKYHALSYTWGDSTNKQYIMINERPFPIRENLFSFLLEVQATQWQGMLWVDALCIDQSNVAELNDQVSIMADIYRSAAEVYAWLGPSTKDSVWLLSRLGVQDDFNLHHPRLDDREFMKYLETIVALGERDYWSRIWIVQELALAKHVQFICGREVLSWDKMAAIFKQYFHRLKLHSSSAEAETIKHLPTIMEVRQVQSQCLAYSICRMGNMMSRERHDRVYALRGLDSAIAGGERPFPVDYSISLPELLRRTLSLVIQSSHELEDLISGKKSAVELLLALVHCWQLSPQDLGDEADHQIMANLPYRDEVGEMDPSHTSKIRRVKTCTIHGNKYELSFGTGPEHDVTDVYYSHLKYSPHSDDFLYIIDFDGHVLTRDKVGGPYGIAIAIDAHCCYTSSVSISDNAAFGVCSVPGTLTVMDMETVSRWGVLLRSVLREAKCRVRNGRYLEITLPLRPWIVMAQMFRSTAFIRPSVEGHGAT